MFMELPPMCLSLDPLNSSCVPDFLIWGVKRRVGVVGKLNGALCLFPKEV